MPKIIGEVQAFKPLEEGVSEDQRISELFALEHYLNNQVASECFVKFGYAVRFHLSLLPSVPIRVGHFPPNSLV